ncbi:cytochrome P450 [Actinomarinicola tropica]|uniref:Cytochrome P450 n=1 Tax=Actinomarinicola tropica TaxID=2789776 RepID=A0A5Q2RNC7_9ACTN|nr:cytochrome P450 [Actinomarinicola tropica]QGG95400.1 cytochrome P450 [Actinomarinicola tropica]
MTDTARPPVDDWATDFDHTTSEYAQNAPEIWADLRSRCPVAHSERFGGTWLPVRHEDVVAVARDTEHFSSEGVIVNDYKPVDLAPIGYAPPITSDPPFHQAARRLLLPAFAPKEIDRWEETARATCRELLDELLADGRDVVDAAVEYTQHIPVRVIADMLGVPREDGDKFRTFIHRIIEAPGSAEQEQIAYEDTLDHYLTQVVEARRAAPREEPQDLVDHLLAADLDGQPLSDDHITGTIGLLIIAGIDTTWSAIGASLWHLAQHPDDRRRLVEDPDVMVFAIEELLRAYAPVTMARIVAEDTEIGGCPVNARDWVLLPFPAANLDPEVFEDPHEVVIDRQRNRHLAFGVGIHRCIGSNLARMELRVGLEEWLRRIPDFELAVDDPEQVRWSAGQVRGPRELPVRILATVPHSTTEVR